MKLIKIGTISLICASIIGLWLHTSSLEHEIEIRNNNNCEAIQRINHKLNVLTDEVRDLKQREQFKKAASRGDERKVYVGELECTWYTLDLRCVPNLNGICADGTKVEEYHTITGPFPIGTRLYIEGIGERVVHDTSNPKYSNRIDNYTTASYEECMEFGNTKHKVYIVR